MGGLNISGQVPEPKKVDIENNGTIGKIGSTPKAQEAILQLKNNVEQARVNQAGSAEQVQVEQKKSDTQAMHGIARNINCTKSSLAVEDRREYQGGIYIKPEAIEEGKIYKRGDFNDIDQGSKYWGEKSTSNMVFNDWVNMKEADFNKYYYGAAVASYSIDGKFLRKYENKIIQLTNHKSFPPESRLSEKDFKEMNDEQLLRKMMSLTENIDDPNFKFPQSKPAALAATATVLTRGDDGRPIWKFLLIDEDYANMTVSADAREMGWTPTEYKRTPKN